MLFELMPPPNQISALAIFHGELSKEKFRKIQEKHTFFTIASLLRSQTVLISNIFYLLSCRKAVVYSLNRH